MPSTVSGSNSQSRDSSSRLHRQGTHRDGQLSHQHPKLQVHTEQGLRKPEHSKSDAGVNPIHQLLDGCKAAPHSSSVLRGFCALLILGMVRHMQHNTRRRMHAFVGLPRSAPGRGAVPARGASQGQARATQLQKREETSLKCSSQGNGIKDRV